ncbi:MAG: helix-turn-helix domain-containing protein [Chloroflexota bacterium]|nr:helix-turn-helix domain-containing protein [Chloroflexota bacterium]
MRIDTPSDADSRLRALLGDLLPSQWTWELVTHPAQAIDALLVMVDPHGVRYPLFVEFKRYVAPADVQPLVAQYAGQKAVVVADAVSPRSREELQKAGWGWADLGTHEALLTIGGLSIDKQMPRPRKRTGTFPEGRVKKLFDGASLRVIRWLLIEPDRRWTVAEMGQRAQVSASFVSRVFASLRSQDWVERRAGRYGYTRVTDPAAMMLGWADTPAQPVEIAQRVSLLAEPPQISMAIAEAANGARYALTGEAAAEFVSPYVRYTAVEVYVDDFSHWDEALGLTRVGRGGNVRLIRPMDQGVFDGSGPKLSSQPRIVSLPQLFVDLSRAGGAAQEAATFLLEQNWA